MGKIGSPTPTTPPTFHPHPPKNLEKNTNIKFCVILNLFHYRVWALSILVTNIHFCWTPQEISYSCTWVDMAMVSLFIWSSLCMWTHCLYNVLWSYISNDVIQRSSHLFGWMQAFIKYKLYGPSNYCHKIPKKCTLEYYAFIPSILITTNLL